MIHIYDPSEILYRLYSRLLKRGKSMAFHNISRRNRFIVIVCGGSVSPKRVGPIETSQTTAEMQCGWEMEYGNMDGLRRCLVNSFFGTAAFQIFRIPIRRRQSRIRRHIVSNQQQREVCSRYYYSSLYRFRCFARFQCCCCCFLFAVLRWGFSVW